MYHPRGTLRTRWAVIGLTVCLHACGGSSSGNSDGGTDPPPPPPPPGPIPPVELVEISVQPAFTSLPAFDQPLAMLQAPADGSRWFVVEREGRVRVFDNDPDASATDTFIDLSAEVDSGPGEAGLLGMAFHPDFESNGEVFLSFTRPGLVSHISRFTSADGGQTLDPGSEQVVLTVVQDFGNHNGGHIAFGSDGFLYAGFGDGGSANDPNDRAQDTTNLLGAMLRLDVDGGSPYAVPPDNPFAGNPVCTQGFGSADCPEIHAWGLRNPWRWSFDEMTGDLWAGDVGQGAWEEIDRIVPGGNYGWRIREGAHCNLDPDCDSTGLIDPVAEYDHSLGQSVTGGYVYRGQQVPGLEGAYLYADFVSGRIWGVFDVDLDTEEVRELADTELGIASFAQANDGELYVLDFNLGAIHAIVEAP